MNPEPIKSMSSASIASAPVCGYIRVSSLDQAVEGVSLGAQRAQVRAYCELHGLRLVGIYQDAGFSAKSTRARPAVQEVLDLIRRRQISGVVVTKLDRLVRSTRDAIDVAELCRKYSVALHSIAEHLDTSTSQGQFFFTLTAGLAELERKTTADRTRSTLRHLREQGLKTGGCVPFGSNVRRRLRGGKRLSYLVPNPAEQGVIRMVRRLRRSGQTLRAIAANLTLRGIRTKLGRPVWHPEGVRSLLRAGTSR